MTTSEAIVDQTQTIQSDVQTNIASSESSQITSTTETTPVSIIQAATTDDLGSQGNDNINRPPSSSSQTSDPPTEPKSMVNQVNLAPNSTPVASSISSLSQAITMLNPAPIAANPVAKLSPLTPTNTVASASTVPSMFSFVLSPKNNKGDFPGIPITLPGYPSVTLQVTQLPGAKTSDQFYLNLATPSVITALSATQKNSKGQIVLSISSQSLVPKNNQPNCVPTTPTVINNSDPKKVRAIAPKPVVSGQAQHSIDISPNGKARNTKRVGSFLPNRGHLLKGRGKKSILAGSPGHINLAPQTLMQNNQIALQAGSKIITNPGGSVINGGLAPAFFSMPNGSTSLVFPQNSIPTSTAATAPATTQFVYDSATGTTRPFLLNTANSLQQQILPTVSQSAPICASIDPTSGLITYFANPTTINGNRAIPIGTNTGQLSTNTGAGSLIFTQPGQATPIFFPGNPATSNGFIQQSLLPSGQVIQNQNIHLKANTTTGIVSTASPTNPIFINSAINMDVNSGAHSSEIQQDGEDILTLAWKLTQMDEETPNSKDVVNLDMMAEESGVTSAETVLNEEDLEKEKEIIESVEKDQKEKSSNNANCIEDIGCLNSTIDIEKLLEQAAQETVEESSKKNDENLSLSKEIIDDKPMPKSPTKSHDDQDFSFLNSFHGDDDEVINLDNINSSLEKEPDEPTVESQAIPSSTIAGEDIEEKNVQNEADKVPCTDRDYETLTTSEQIEDTLNFLKQNESAENLKSPSRDDPKDATINQPGPKPTEEDDEDGLIKDEMISENQLDLDLERAVAESNLTFEPGGENSLFDLIFLPDEEDETLVNGNEDLLNENTQDPPPAIATTIKELDKHHTDDESDSGSELDFLPQQKKTVAMNEKEIFNDNDSILESTVAMLDENKNSPSKESLPHSDNVDEGEEEAKSHPSPDNNNSPLPPVDTSSILEVIAEPNSILLNDIENYEDEEVSPIKSNFHGLKSLDKMLKTCQKKSVDSSIVNITISSSSTDNNTTTDQSLNDSGKSVMQEDFGLDQKIDNNQEPTLDKVTEAVSEESDDEEEQEPIRSLRSRPTPGKKSPTKKKRITKNSGKGKSVGHEKESNLLPEENTSIDKEPVSEKELQPLNSTFNSNENTGLFLHDFPINSNSSFCDLTNESRPKSFGLDKDLSSDNSLKDILGKEKSVASVANFSFLSKDKPLIETGKIQFQPPELNSDSDREDNEIDVVSTGKDEVEKDKSHQQISGIKFSSCKAYEGGCCSSSSASPDEIFHSGCHVDLPINSICRIGESYDKLNSSTNQTDIFQKFTSRQDLLSFETVCKENTEQLSAVVSCKESTNFTLNKTASKEQSQPQNPSGTDYLKKLVLPDNPEKSNPSVNIFSQMIQMVLTDQNSQPMEIFKALTDSMNKSLNHSSTFEYNEINSGFAPKANPIYDNIPDSRTPSPSPAYTADLYETDPLIEDFANEFNIDVNLEYSNLTIVENPPLFNGKIDVLIKDLSKSIKYLEPKIEPVKVTIQSEAKSANKRKLKKSSKSNHSSKKRKVSGEDETVSLTTRPSIKIHIALPQKDTTESTKMSPKVHEVQNRPDGNDFMDENHEDKENNSDEPSREPIKLKLKLPFINSCKEELVEKKKRREEKKLLKEARRQARKLKFLSESAQKSPATVDNSAKDSSPHISIVNTPEQSSIPSPEPIPKKSQPVKPVESLGKKSRGRPPRGSIKKQTKNVNEVDPIPNNNDPSKDQKSSSESNLVSKRIFSTSKEDRRSSAVFSRKSCTRPGPKKLSSSKITNYTPVKSLPIEKNLPPLELEEPAEKEEDESKPLKLVIKFGGKSGSDEKFSKIHKKETGPMAKKRKNSSSQSEYNHEELPRDVPGQFDSYQSHDPQQDSSSTGPTYLDHLLMVADAAETFMDVHQSQVKKVENQAALSMNHNSGSNSTMDKLSKTCSTSSNLFPKEPTSYFSKSSEQSIFHNVTNDYPSQRHPHHDQNYVDFKNPQSSSSSSVVPKSQPNHTVNPIVGDSMMSPLKKRPSSKSKTPNHPQTTSSVNSTNIVANTSLDMSTGSSDTTLDIIDDTNTPPNHLTPNIQPVPSSQSGSIPQVTHPHQNMKKSNQSLATNQSINPFQDDLNNLANSTGGDENAFTAACQAVYQQQFAAAMASYYQSAQFKRESNDYNAMSYPFPEHLHQQQAVQHQQQQQPKQQVHHPTSHSSQQQRQQPHSHHRSVVEPVQHSHHPPAHLSHQSMHHSSSSSQHLPHHQSSTSSRQQHQNHQLSDRYQQNTSNNLQIEDSYRLGNNSNLPPYINQFFDTANNTNKDSLLNPMAASNNTSSNSMMNNDLSSGYGNIPSSMQEYYSSAYTAVQQYAAAFNFYQSKYSEWSGVNAGNVGDNTGGTSSIDGNPRNSSKR